jgi:NAD(P)-dependent dehydrogenase (short-subunit alcohol dehydrogenase family)
VEAIEDLSTEGCELLALDVTDERPRTDAVATIEERYGAVGALVNSAGFSQSGAVESVTLERARRQFETNVFGPLELCRLVLPAMRAASGPRAAGFATLARVTR